MKRILKVKGHIADWYFSADSDEELYSVAFDIVNRSFEQGLYNDLREVDYSKRKLPNLKDNIKRWEAAAEVTRKPNGEIPECIEHSLEAARWELNSFERQMKMMSKVSKIIESKNGKEAWRFIQYTVDKDIKLIELNDSKEYNI